MDEPITKRLIISGLTPAITVDDLSRRLTSFGTVKAADGFGLPDGVGNPRNFGYVTLDTTVGKLAKCMNLLSGSTWKGAKLRFGEAKPDFKERIAAENKKAAEEPPTKKRKRFGGVEAEDMTPITPEDAAKRPGWKVSTLGRITKPVKMRPAHPLPEVIEDKKAKPGVVKFSDVKKPVEEGEKKKKKRVRDPDTRARRKVIDMTKYGSTHMKGMFLDLEVSVPTTRPERHRDIRPEDLVDNFDSDASEVEAHTTTTKPTKSTLTKKPSAEEHVTAEVVAGPSGIQPKHTAPKSPLPIPVSKPVSPPAPALTHIPASVPAPPLAPKPVKPGAAPVQIERLLPTPASFVSDKDIDIEQEKKQSLNLLNSLFGNDDDDWVGQEDVDSDIDVSNLVKGDRMLVDEDDDIEVVPLSAPLKRSLPVSESDEESDEEEEEPEKPATIVASRPTQPASEQLVPVKDSRPKSLKDMFAPRDEEAGFSLLGHLDLDLELDEDPLGAEITSQQQTQAEVYNASIQVPITLQTHPSQAPLVLDPRKALFFPLPREASGNVTRARQRDVFDLAKDNGWNWRDPAVGFYRTGTEEDIKKRWEESKGDLTKDWKRRCREAAKVSRRKRGGVEGGDEF